MQTDLKKRIYDYCIAQIDERIAHIKQAMEDAQEAANEDNKSSAGDKYETNRAMMQLEQEKILTQLAAALDLQKAIRLINPDKIHTVVQPGSLVTTNNGIFFISVSLGKIVIDGNTYFAISPSSPMGAQLIGLTPGKQITVNGKLVSISALC